MDLFEYDKAEGIDLICGVDEAGRGPLAGDVYAGAVILPQNYFLEGLNDSKKLNEKRREELYEIIVKDALSFGVGIATVAEIDEKNILQATFLAMKRAVEKLSIEPKLVLVDGNQNPKLDIHSRCVVKGDATSASIAAASIIAKVSRDRYMKELAKQYPQYQFEKHKGYGTTVHYKCLDEFGISDVHRKSFLKKYLAGEKNIPQKRGELGEEIVTEYLISKGYLVLEKNHHSSFGEIDIIAKKENIIAFVEVKARKQGSLISAKESVNRSK
ncbi:MAG: ribonuclease HII, partial [Oscillospiraceae bacterium]